jgi:hypothetical protein
VSVRRLNCISFCSVSTWIHGVHSLCTYTLILHHSVTQNFATSKNLYTALQLVTLVRPLEGGDLLNSHSSLNYGYKNLKWIYQRLTASWTIGWSAFDSRRELGIFLFHTASRPVLGPTEPPIQWVPGALSLGLKRPECEADHSPPYSAEVKECVELYLHSPIRLYGVMLR